MKIAFYLAKYGNTYDKAISITTFSKYSHCELVFSDGMCGSASPRDGGVRLKKITLDDHWHVFDLPTDLDEDFIRYWFAVNDDLKYDWIGAIASVVNIDLSSEGKRYCSQICGDLLWLDTTITPGGLFRKLKSIGYIK